MLAPVAIFFSRALLVALFFPFSALDKLLNFRAALGQAQQHAPSRGIAGVLLAAGFAVEVFMSLGVLTGVADRACALVLALYCVVTALLWKQFWRRSIFRFVGLSPGREVFWDFLKNLAVAGGFLTLALGSTVGSVNEFLAAPLASHYLYGLATGRAR